MSTKDTIEKLLSKADVTLNGPNPWDIQVHNDAFYDRVFAGGSLAVGESYMDGWWDAEALDELISRILGAKLKNEVGKNLETLFYIAKSKLFNQQSRSRAFQVGEEHYDVGNELYERMLDKRMTYTCGYWSGTPRAQTLDEAQEAKLDLVCRKIGLKKGDTVLDIGGGWGSFAQFAYENYGAETVAITISKEQADLGRARTKNMPIEIRVQDYRDLSAEEQFDHVVSLGMFEHVGYKNYTTYMDVVRSVLKDGGTFLLHTIGSSVTGKTGDPWIDKYIFPNGKLPSIAQIGHAIEQRFVMEDWHNFGLDYDKTLQAWRANFERAWPEIKEHYNDRFYRMWWYYLSASMATFRVRNSHLWQIVLSKNGIPGGYTSVR